MRTPLHRPHLLLALAALLCCLFPAGARAQGDVLRTSSTPQKKQVLPGEQIAIAVVLELQSGWHAWPNKPVVPPELEDLLAIPTEVSVEGALPDAIGVHLDHTQWPEPHTVESAAFTGEPLKLLSYSGRMVLYIPVTIDAAAKPGSVTIPISVSYQACDDTTCRPPTTSESSVVIEVLAPGASPTPPDTSDLFTDFNPAVFAKILSTGAPSTTPKPPVAAPSAAPAPAAAAPGLSIFGYPLPDPRSPLGIAVLLLVSILGGALMNLTPCVLPVIPIKVMTLTQHAGAHGGALRLGLWMALGIIAFWTAIGVPMAFVSAALDPSRFIFGIWWVTTTIGLVIAVLSLGLMGMFNLTLPQSLYAFNPKADNAWGSFLFGIMTGVLGLPCFGFVAGGLLVAAATMPSLSTLSIFFGIGFGMAAPFVVLAANPALLKKMPRTGPASELVKQVMGLMLLAGAGYFIAVGLKALVGAKPYYGDTMHWWAAAFFLVLAGLWLIVRTFQITRKPARRVIFAVISLVMAASAVAFAASETAIQRENYLKLQQGAAASDEFVPGAWNHYTPAAFQKARDTGAIVIADYTADWCLICKTLKRTVLDRDPVSAEIMKRDVIVFEVNLTRQDAPGWDFLRSIGRTGIPTLAIFKPGVDEPQILNAYTAANVIDALNWARAK